MDRLRRQAGFTLMEITLVVSLIGVMIALSIPVYTSLMTRNDLDVAVTQIRTSITTAERLAQATAGDVAWSVHVVTGSSSIYPGSVYSAGAAGQVYNFPSNLTVSGPSDVLFSKMTGLPTSTPTFTITNRNNETRTVSVNAQGTISVQ